MNAGVLVPIFVPMALFATIFGIVYLRSREKMAMIERGMDPRSHIARPVNRNYTLTTGLLLIGAGLGLFLAFILDSVVFHEESESPAIYFSLIAIFGGLGLVIAYLIERKESRKTVEE